MSPKALTSLPKVLKALIKKGEHLREHLARMMALRQQHKRLILALALRPLRGYRSLVVANSATGFGDPIRHWRTGAPIMIAGAFFVPAHPVYGGCARETSGSAGSLCPRFANLRTAATLIRLATNRGGSTDKELHR